MNLIEQLGGYELAKQVFDTVPKDGNSYTVTRDDTGASFHSGEIFKALLEYRRQHNIFDVGDKVVFNSYELDAGIREIQDYHNGCIGAVFRHATDEEIKLGYRIN